MIKRCFDISTGHDKHVAVLLSKVMVSNIYYSTKTWFFTTQTEFNVSRDNLCGNLSIFMFLNYTNICM